MERQLVIEYEQTIKELLLGLTKKNHNLAVEISKIPEQIRGFDMVKQRNVESAKSAEKVFLKQFRNSVENTTGQKSSEVVS